MCKMTVNKTARFLCVLAALLVQMLTVNATMYYHSDHQRDSSLYETAASVKTESSKTCHESGVHEVCQSAHFTESGEETRYFHVCPSDGDPCNPRKCYYSSESLCCPRAIGLKCIETSDLLVGGEITEVTFNRITLSDEICVSVSPAVNACDADCVTQCRETECKNNTICDGTNCRCKEGYGSPGEGDCCNCAEGNVTHPYYKTEGTCKKYCKINCRSAFPGGPCATCRQGFTLPECCNCDTKGNDTHAFYKPDCKPFCKLNCDGEPGERGCDRCKAGYVGEPECCDCDNGFYNTTDGKCLQSTECDKDQDLYFLIDATAGNNYPYFCQEISVIQVLVAAFNPSSSSESGTKIMAWLFGKSDEDPSPVFSSSMNCNDIVNNRLATLITEFGKCRDSHSNYRSKSFPSSCGGSSLAVSGLETIAAEIERRGKLRNRAMVILTDGKLEDDDKKVQEVRNRLTNTIIIAGGIIDAKHDDLKRYTPNEDNVKVKDDPIDLGLAIVDRLHKTGVLCSDHATNIREKLNAHKVKVNEDKNLYCQCHDELYENDEKCKGKVYPKCGGDLTFGVFQKHTSQLEEEILAAVESVLENYSG